MSHGGEILSPDEVHSLATWVKAELGNPGIIDMHAASGWDVVADMRHQDVQMSESAGAASEAAPAAAAASEAAAAAVAPEPQAAAPAAAAPQAAAVLEPAAAEPTAPAAAALEQAVEPAAPAAAPPAFPIVTLVLGRWAGANQPRT